MKRRRGLSYLEVLIAAGIALVGLLGAVALFPVAIMNLRKGQTVDTMAAIGPSVLNSITPLHVDDPTYWMTRVGGTMVEVQNPGYPSRAEWQGRTIHPAVQPWDALCFDPRYVAQVATWDAAQSDPTLFPAVPMASPLDARMRRMTLWGGRSGSPKPKMDTPQARLLWKCQDDLLFERPEDKTAPARQLAVNNGTNQRRDYYADYEFVITAVPVTEMREPLPDIIPDPNNPGRFIRGPYVYDPNKVFLANDGEYDVAAVIFRERTPDLSEIVASADPTFVQEERLCDLAFLTPGYNGGDVTITTRPGRPASDMNIVDTSWALVSGVETVTYTPPAPWGPPAVRQRPVFKWYRVVNFTEIYGSSRDLTLDGPDWPANTSNIRITLASGVCGVFTKTMLLK
jgi:hypothetical protein